jgi:N-6 DNA Methylase
MTSSVIMETLSGLPAKFKDLLVEYHSQISEAVRRNAHHDHRRALLIDFLRNTFGIEVDEIELEKKIKVAEARGRIDAFYKFVIFEVKIDLDRERNDAVRELKKYFESRSTPSDYIAVVTDGLTFEIFDYDTRAKEPKLFRSFNIDPDRADLVYLELDELLASGGKIPPSSDDIVGRFGLRSTTFLRAISRLEEAFISVESDSAVTVKFREWNALLAKVYGSAVGDRQLYLRHTYLTILSRAIVTMALFPKHHRGSTLYRDLLTGKYFRDQGILNLAEPDFFSWALDNIAEQPFNEVFHAIFRRLDEFDWTKLDEDLLKMLYQELIDPDDRSGLGEYYTPDWLAEMILEDIGYDGGSLLDPSCGSGTFLFCTIRRRKRQGLRGDELIRFAMDSLIGLDVHPVAVLMAKANILLALASELKKERDFDIQLRVYMADTLHTDEKSHKNFLGVAVGDGREFAIPLKSLELDRDLDLLVNQMASFANRGTTKDTDQAARRGFLSKLADLTTEEQNLWRINYHGGSRACEARYCVGLHSEKRVPACISAKDQGGCHRR